MRWIQPSDLAVLLCSLTKVWISQGSTVTVHPSSSPSQHIMSPKHKQREKEGSDGRAGLFPLHSLHYHRTLDPLWGRERKALTTALITSWWWGQALWLTLRTSGSVWPRIEHEQCTFIACVQCYWGSFWDIYCINLIQPAALLWTLIQHM